MAHEPYSGRVATREGPAITKAWRDLVLSAIRRPAIPPPTEEGPAVSQQFDCQECGKLCTGSEYHPFLHCELVKLGHRDPDAYLASYGYTRVAEGNPPPTEETSDGG